MADALKVKVVVCDDCWETGTGLIAECEEGCPRNLDHVGLCWDRRYDADPCTICGASDTRLHATLPR